MFKKLFEKKSPKDQDDKKDNKDIEQSSKAKESKSKETADEPSIEVKNPVISEASTSTVDKSSVSEAVVLANQEKESVKIMLQDSEINLEKLKSSTTPLQIFIFVLLLIFLIFAITVTAYLLFGVFLNQTN